MRPSDTETQLSREQDAAETWVVRLVDAVRRYDESAAQMPPLSEATALAARAKRDLEAGAQRRGRAAPAHSRARSGPRRPPRGSAERFDVANAVSQEVASRNDLEAASALPAL